MVSRASPESLRLLLVNWQDLGNPDAGGAEVHLHEIFGRLAARGHRVSLLCSSWKGASPREEVDGIDVVRTGGRYTFPLHVRSGYRSLGSGPVFDLVIEDINKLPLFTPLWVDAPVVGLVPHLFGTTAFREEAAPIAAAVWAAERAIPAVYRNVAFQAISESTAADLIQRGISASRVEVIQPGIDHETYSPDPRVEEFASETVVYVGRLKRYKGLGRVIRVLVPLAARGIRARLLIAGQGDDRARLELVAAESGMGEQVEFLGYVSEERKVELLRRAWVSVYPSPKEGWGITNVEAAACGTPTVASDSPGLRESVDDGRSGYLVSHDAVDQWTDRLSMILTDSALRARLVSGAIEHAGRFSWDRAADETERALRRIHRTNGGN